MAVTAAMESDDSNIVCVRDTYKKRCDIMVESFSQVMPLPDVTVVAEHQYWLFQADIREREWLFLFGSIFVIMAIPMYLLLSKKQASFTTDVI